MALASYRGFTLKSIGTTNQIWKVTIKNRELQGSLSAVKKSIDWWCDTASIIDPSQLTQAATERASGTAGTQENFHGFTIKNDTGANNAWYCMFNGKLIKGGKLAIQRHIEAYLIAKKKAEQTKN
ncbi:DUF3319 domain-containing protein [Vibrio mediterranei]|jgi:hypothetical protein|uniref:DUF3319 domain-containing protein n=1 Tax=Vibrio barjaei TaxID=1676683 RepID=UPI0007BB3F52|nr:DUF3319 domain-containing protein [Vibrio barjaei]MCG9788761.1 DUF3319 domain-containing protein [Vibrio mediterranei]OIN23901.1 phage tail protein [Vibrio barjaei]